ncbi:Histidine ammonia-lyase [Holothuria leucospilota]|uniref:Histidine ammonia-lyase n=1 Tax=Holothuria leucospilota TaxID=206669 RepID=A0A9Q1CT78_HOLLE|nr:Histidine ammonia-lyase [Holothuria leucospilota]
MTSQLTALTYPNVFSSRLPRLLQENLIRSTLAGVGKPFSPEHTRKLLALRINVLVKGCSSVSKETLNKLVAAFNASCLPWIPEKGTVGTCGDLTPLAHLALGMMGEGKMWSPETGWGDAGEVLAKHGLQPVKLLAKEGLALINGAQLITALGAEGLQLVITEEGEIVSAGNFHGEYPAKVLDYLAIGVHELANISERRTERLINPISENKVLMHPASVDSLPTSNGQEDHVSMGGFAARKALQVVEHVEQGKLNVANRNVKFAFYKLSGLYLQTDLQVLHWLCNFSPSFNTESKVLAIELLAACQGVEFRKHLKTTAPLQAVYNLVRTVVKFGKPLGHSLEIMPPVSSMQRVPAGRVERTSRDA